MVPLYTAESTPFLISAMLGFSLPTVCSSQFYEKAFALDTAYTLDYKLPYSVHLAGLGAFEKALIAINELLTKKPPKNPSGIETVQKRPEKGN